MPPARPDRPISWLPIVLSDGFWRHEMSASPAVIGRQIRIEQLYPYNFMVVGVAPPGFNLPQDADGWVPEHLTSASEIQIAALPNWEEFAVCRLRPGVSPRAAAMAMRAWPRNLRDWNWSGSTSLTPLRQYLGGDLFRLVGQLRLMALAFLALSLAAVGGLFLRGFEERFREIWTRCLLGGTPTRVVRMLGIELAVALTMALPLAGLVRGGMLRLVERHVTLPGHAGWSVDRANWALAAAAGMALALLVLLPTGWGLVRQLQRGRVQRPRRGGGVFRYSAQISCATVIVIAAVVLLGVSGRIAALPPGLAPEGVFAAELSLPLFYDDYVWADIAQVPYKQRAPLIDARAREFRRRIGLDYERLVARLREVNGVEDAGAISITPYSGYSALAYEVV
ncbi:MAG: hypothetical protein ACRD1E_05655, partial [Terriglobales bacterium]